MSVEPKYAFEFKIEKERFSNFAPILLPNNREALVR
jgi:hypothetical protein